MTLPVNLCCHPLCRHDLRWHGNGYCSCDKEELIKRIEEKV